MSIVLSNSSYQNFAKYFPSNRSRHREIRYLRKLFQLVDVRNDGGEIGSKRGKKA